MNKTFVSPHLRSKWALCGPQCKLTGNIIFNGGSAVCTTGTTPIEFPFMFWTPSLNLHKHLSHWKISTDFFPASQLLHPLCFEFTFKVSLCSQVLLNHITFHTQLDITTYFCSKEKFFSCHVIFKCHRTLHVMLKYSQVQPESHFPLFSINKTTSAIGSYYI